MAQQPRGFVIYSGPSQLDGEPIVAIAITKSSNAKTGNMVQTYILRRDMRPTAAVRNGADASICGDCKHRPSNGGACYVVVAQGPTAVYKAWEAMRYPYRGRTAAPGWEAGLEALGAGRMVRIGTYGDPAAVPVEVWERLTAQAAGRTGYTHQWRNEALDADQMARLRLLVMASADSAQEAQEARAAGMRYFRIRTAAEPLQAREFVCPASEEAGKRVTCAQCGACNGSERAQAASPVIVVHGSKASRFSAPVASL